MTDFETMKRVQWDGLERTKAGRVAMKVASVSDIRVHTLLLKQRSLLRTFVIAVPAGLAVGFAIGAAIKAALR